MLFNCVLPRRRILADNPTPRIQCGSWSVKDWRTWVGLYLTRPSRERPRQRQDKAGARSHGDDLSPKPALQRPDAGWPRAGTATGCRLQD